jgi:hypothetical protein
VLIRSASRQSYGFRGGTEMSKVTIQAASGDPHFHLTP